MTKKRLFAATQKCAKKENIVNAVLASDFG